MARSSHISGFIRVICGPMYAGKSDELIRRISRNKFACIPTIVFKPLADSRTINQICSRNSTLSFPAITIKESYEILDYIQNSVELPKVIAIDEAQFFDDELINVCVFLANNGFEVIVAGLDKDFKGEPFQIISKLSAISDEVHKLSSICTKCGKEATYSQRLVNNEPAKYDEPIVLIGDKESYTARCRKCFELPNNKTFNNIRYKIFKQMLKTKKH